MCCMSSPSLCLGLASKAKATIPQAIPSVFFLCCFVKEVPRKLPRGKEKVVLIKEVIKYYLESQNIDGETYVEPIRDVEKEDARIKNREKKKARNAMVNEENQVEGDKGYVYVDDNGGGDEERTEDADDKEDDDEEDDARL